MGTMPIRRSAWIVVAVAALVLTACSSSGGSSSNATTSLPESGKAPLTDQLKKACDQLDSVVKVVTHAAGAASAEPIAKLAANMALIGGGSGDPWLRKYGTDAVSVDRSAPAASRYRQVAAVYRKYQARCRKAGVPTQPISQERFAVTLICAHAGALPTDITSKTPSLELSAVVRRILAMQNLAGAAKDPLLASGVGRVANAFDAGADGRPFKSVFGAGLDIKGLPQAIRVLTQQCAVESALTSGVLAPHV